MVEQLVEHLRVEQMTLGQLSQVRAHIAEHMKALVASRLTYFAIATQLARLQKQVLSLDDRKRLATALRKRVSRTAGHANRLPSHGECEALTVPLVPTTAEPTTMPPRLLKKVTVEETFAADNSDLEGVGDTAGFAEVAAAADTAANEDNEGQLAEACAKPAGKPLAGTSKGKTPRRC